MALNLRRDKGVPLERQRFTWRDLVRQPISKLDDDAFTHVRIVLMNSIEAESVRFQHGAARTSRQLRSALARVRRVEHHQQTLVNWLLPPDMSPLETTLTFEQVAIEVTAHAALSEPDPYLAQVYRFGLLEDFDHLYRYAALLDRVEGKDANTILHSYTDIVHGRPTYRQHRHPTDDLRTPYERHRAAPVSKLNAYTIMAAENQTHDYYMTVGPGFADPVARRLYAEIASIEEQHLTQYESIIDPDESLLERWLLHEATEAYNYYACLQYESNPRIKQIWERMLEYELGHVHFVAELFEDIERRDAASVLPERLPEPIRYESHRDFVRQVLRCEMNLSAAGTRFVDMENETADTRDYRRIMNAEGSPSYEVAADYVWTPGTELMRTLSPATADRHEDRRTDGHEDRRGDHP